MAVEQLTHKILEDARLQADQVQANAKAEGEKILEQARLKAEAECSVIIATGKEQADELYERLMSVAKLNARKDLLQVKQDLISTTFAEALSRLRSLPEQEYFKLLLDFIVAASTTGQEQILISEADQKRLPSSFLADANQGVKAKGLEANLSFAPEPAKIDGGFILMVDDIFVNYSFEALLKQNYDDLAMEVAALLFS